MGMTFENLTEEELCDLMCGDPEEDFEFEHYDKKLAKIDDINKSYILSKKINKIKTKKRFYKMRKCL